MPEMMPQSLAVTTGAWSRAPSVLALVLLWHHCCGSADKMFVIMRRAETAFAPMKSH